jgi:hypothetical protein
MKPGSGMGETPFGRRLRRLFLNNLKKASGWGEVFETVSDSFHSTPPNKGKSP